MNLHDIRPTRRELTTRESHNIAWLLGRDTQNKVRISDDAIEYWDRFYNAWTLWQAVDSFDYGPSLDVFDPEDSRIEWE